MSLMNAFGSAYGSASAITPVWATLIVTLVSIVVMKKNDPIAPEDENFNEHSSSKKYENP